MKKMSKILSIILAISMVISMLPATFAADGDTETTDAGYKIVYDFVDSYSDEFYKERAELSSNTELAVQSILSKSYDYTYGFWMLDSTTSDIPSFNHYYNNSSWTGARVYFNANKPYFSMKIKVPAEGDYTLGLKVGQHSAAESSLDIYVLDSSVTKEAITQKLADSDDKTGLVGTVNANGTNKDAEISVSETAIHLENKEYIVVFHAKTPADAIIKNLTLTSGDGSLLAPMHAELDGDKTLDAAIDETASFKALLSDGKTWINNGFEDYGITFESSAEDVATVDENGVVTAVSEGTATITAKNGDFILGEEEVTVTETPDAGVTVVYPMSQPIYNSDGSTPSPTGVTYTHVKSAGRIAYQGNNSTVSGSLSWSSGSFALHTKSENEYVVFKIKVPKSGAYDVSAYYGMSSSGSKAEMFILPVNYSENEIKASFATEKPVLKTNANSSANGNATVGYDQFSNVYAGTAELSTLPVATGKVVLDEGEYLAVWRAVGDYTWKDGSGTPARYILIINTMVLDGGTGLAIMDASVGDYDKTLSVGGTTTVTATGTLSNTGLQKNIGGAANFTYASSNPAVATVNETTGVVTAVSGGVAKITATCTDENVIDGYKSVSTLIAVDEPTTEVSFGADASVDGITITTDVDDYVQGDVGSVGINTMVKVTAPETYENYVFRGWVRGNADGGRVISLDATYGFTAMTNTYLTAIYTEAANEEYYAWNGEFLGTSKPEEGSEPEVLGYSFSEWKESLVNSVKRFVAQYVQMSTTYGVTYNGNTTQHKYDDPVTLSSDTDVYWYRDGKLVDYGTSYTFNVWDKTEITTSSEGHNLPMLVLDAKAKDGNYMVEYDANGKTIIEVGILFNADTDNAPTVESCKEKMNSQRDLSEKEHGQFAAKAGTYTQARGYLVYEDNGTYKVIYSE